MSFWKKLFGGNRPVDDEPVEKQKEDMMHVPFFADGTMEIKEDCDELPNAYGAFGTSVTNPVPVNGPMGETIYINRLRSRSGVGFFYHRLKTCESPICEQTIDVYELLSLDGRERVTLYFSMYHPRRSTMVPDGLTLRSWSSLKEQERVFCRLDGFGTRQPVANFPLGLPDAVEKDPVLNYMSPGLGMTMAARVRERLKEIGYS